MSREKQRQANRLRRLADFIAQNPKQFDMQSSVNCILGLANRMRKGKVAPKSREYGEDRTTLTLDFSKRYGVPEAVGEQVFVGNFDKVSRNFKSYNDTGWAISVQKIPVRSAVAMLNHLAKRVESGSFAQ